MATTSPRLCGCGCGQPAKNAFVLRGHNRKNGSAKRSREQETALFWQQVDKSLVEGGCWTWTGQVDAGYGRGRLDGKRDGAHRIAWRLVNNRDIPDEQVVRHTCNNPVCVNPDHLVLGTQVQNIADRDAVGHTAAGQRNAAAKLTADQVREIRNRSRMRGDREVLAREFGVSVSTIKQIRAGTIWQEVQ